jgi:hypothetical protein
MRPDASRPPYSRTTRLKSREVHPAAPFWQTSSLVQTLRPSRDVSPYSSSRKPRFRVGTFSLHLGPSFTLRFTPWFEYDGASPAFGPVGRCPAGRSCLRLPPISRAGHQLRPPGRMSLNACVPAPHATIPASSRAARRGRGIPREGGSSGRVGAPGAASELQEKSVR